MPVTLPYWGQLTVEIDGTTLSSFPQSRLASIWARCLPSRPWWIRSAMASWNRRHAALLALAGRLPPADATVRAVGGRWRGVARRHFRRDRRSRPAADCGGAAIGAFVRRVGRASAESIQPLCAAAIAGAIAGAAGRLQLSEAITLIAFCPCMVLVPGPHLLNGAIDLARTRIALGIARLAYAGVIVLMICAGLWFGLVATGATLPAAGSSAPTPLIADVIAAGCAVAAFGTFFSLPWRLLPFPIVVGMLAHAVRWAVISMASANAVTGAFVACIIVSVIVTPVANRLHLPFAALGFSAVVSMMPGFFLFHAASALVELVSIGPRAPADLLTSVAVNGTTAFLVILAMALGLILPRLLFSTFLPRPNETRQGCSMDRNAVQYASVAPRYQEMGQELCGHLIRYTVDGSGFALEVFRMGDDKSMRRQLNALARVALLSLMASPASLIAQGTAEERRLHPMRFAYVVRSSLMRTRSLRALDRRTRSSATYASRSSLRECRPTAAGALEPEDIAR